jgi:Xaa-Pro dipeptidase
MDHAQLESAYQAHVAHLKTVYTQALETAGLDGVLIHSGSLMKRTQFDDQSWPLRLVPYFQHWAHLPWPECALLVLKAGPVKLLAYEDKSFWERWTQPDWNLLMGCLDVVRIDEPSHVKKHLPNGRRLAYVGENPTRAAEWGVDISLVNPAALLEPLNELRVHKTRYEQLCLEEANLVACRGHQKVAAAFHAGERSELRLHLHYLAETSQDDPETPYKNIVAIGSSAAILHHVSYRKERLDGPVSLLVDAGATFQGYASDITRTHVATGSADAELFSELIGRVDRMQQQLCKVATVGRGYETLHDETHVLLAHILRDLDIVRMGVEEQVQSGITRMFLPHGLGHSLGLVCHDVGCAKIKPRPENAWLRNTRIIEPNQCFTIEPGVYFIDTFMEQLRTGPHGSAANWKVIDQLRPYGGVRIEDDLVVQAAGLPVQNLTRAFLH